MIDYRGLVGGFVENLRSGQYETRRRQRQLLVAPSGSWFIWSCHRRAVQASYPWENPSNARIFSDFPIVALGTSGSSCYPPAPIQTNGSRFGRGAPRTGGDPIIVSQGLSETGGCGDEWCAGLA
jgi:hypothetical protein